MDWFNLSQFLTVIQLVGYLLFFGFPVIYYFSKKRIESVEVTKIHYDQIVKVKIQLAEEELELAGLIDSGEPTL